ncbi:MAG: DNA recombination protein RmuC [Ignavibacteriales bacterium]|nr:DNA recombination protein RmuC [Ignavibacteriales bacterium]MBI3787990.1 DNA recombination protein RmuC [Ignavibacteriales bacterium]
MESVLIIVLLVLVAGLLVYLVMKQTSSKGNSTDLSLLMQQQIDGLRGEVSQNLKNTSDSLSTSLQHTTDVVFKSLQSTTETVNQQLSNVTNQLSSVTQQLQNNTGQMGNRLDNAARVIQDVQNQLGELGQATKEIKELGQSVSKLEEMLKAPKLRGGLGELLLEDLLKQVLPSSAYDIQYTFKNGQTVDAIINTAGGKVPVDSKFPLENFKKMTEAKSEQEKKTAYRTFVSDVKKHIDAISQKYIVPDEGTFDFALMYIPAENIYYETIIKDESFDEENGLYSYATKKHVVPVSPNSFYAHLRVIALGLKGLQIEKSARQIFENLSRLNTELQKFTELFETLGTHLTNAKNNYDKADKQLSGFSERLKGVQSLPSSNGNEQLGAFKEKT